MPKFLEDLGAQNNDVFDRPVARTCPDCSNLVHNIHAINYLTKHAVLPIQMRGRGEADKELAPIRTRTGIGHREHPRLRVLERRFELILELATPDRGSPTTCAGRVTALQHEAGDDPVEDDVVVLACVAQTSEVLDRL